MCLFRLHLVKKPQIPAKKLKSGSFLDIFELYLFLLFFAFLKITLWYKILLKP